MVDIRRSEPPDSMTESPGRPRAVLARRTVFCLSEEETLELGKTLSRALQGGDLVLLEGDLGLGKTILAKGIAAGLGIDPAQVTSPSFTLVQEYSGGRLPIFHLDLYRLEDAGELESVGIEEILLGGGIVMVEWGERLPPYLRKGALRVRFHDAGEGSRRIEVLPQGRSSPPRRSDA